MRLKKTLRLIALILMISLSCIVPIPMTFYKKDHLPKDLIERIDNKKDDNEDEDSTKQIYKL